MINFPPIILIFYLSSKLAKSKSKLNLGYIYFFYKNQVPFPEFFDFYYKNNHFLKC